MDTKREVRRSNGRGGFTLIELMVVIVILGLLATIVGRQVVKNVSKAKQTTAKAQIETLSGAIEEYRLDMGDYPASGTGLGALVTSPGSDKWGGPYIKEKAIPNDPWDKPYIYSSSGNSFEIISYGKDGTPGGTGEDKDVSSSE